ncbi:MAG: hypothetical protein KQH53_18495 [Desulfarculaceae bacterium]|nr:hypothetical protein [Desulfarculaceae bacterium]
MTPKSWSLIWLLAALALIAACAPPFVDPGPNPARVVVSVKRTLDAQSVQSAMQAQGPFPGRAVRFDGFTGPFWGLRVEIKQPDGKWFRLPLAKGQGDMPDGYSVDIRRVFLAPPGRQELRFRLEANINRSWQQQVGDPYVTRSNADGSVYQVYDPQFVPQSEAIYLLDQKRERTLELKGGQEVALKPFD